MPNDSNIHIKSSTSRYDRETYPEQQDAIRMGKEKWEKMKDDVGPGRTFENEAAKVDYLRRVASNPDNVPGLPVFLPREEIKSIFNLPHDCAKMGHRPSNTIDKFCVVCFTDL